MNMHDGGNSKEHNVKRPISEKTKQHRRKKTNSPRIGLQHRNTTVATNAVNAIGLPGFKSEGTRERVRDFHGGGGFRSVQGMSGSNAGGKIDSGGIANDDESVEISKTNETLTNSNFVQLLRTCLMNECQSHINGSALALPEPVSLSLSKRIQIAVQANKIFSVYGYYPIIVEELKKRNWVEKRDPEFKPLNYEYLNITLPLTTSSRIPNIQSPPLLVQTPVETLTMEVQENACIWSAVKNIKPNYVFTAIRKYIDQNISDTIVLSHLDNLNFSNKVGLAENVKAISKKVNVKFPRTYSMLDQRARDDFLKDYRFTAVLSALKMILNSKKSRKMIFNANGIIPYEMIDFVGQRCWEFLNAYQTKDVKMGNMLWFTTHSEDGWNKFMDWYYKLVEESATIRLYNSFQINDIYERFNSLARKFETLCPQFFIDGSTNLWIIKPANSCSGLGIQLERNFNTILKILKKSEQINQSYVIQKYIEKPLKIFNVKVDLRQYFLITNTHPLKIWLYREGYVRFCSKQFSVSDLSEAVHLSNVRVQSNYRKYRISGVPEECMWDFEQFKQYLTSIENGDKWNTSIYPSICETILTIVSGNYNQSSSNKCSFQLFGADFVLTENFEPWLIEINGNPGLNPTTSIIARIVTMLLRDIIKVTVDFPLNSNTDTGLFENIYTDKFAKHNNAKKNYTKEYYYHQVSKNIKQLNKQSHKGIKKN